MKKPILGKAVAVSLWMDAIRGERKPPIPPGRIEIDKRRKLREKQDREDMRNW